MSSLLSHRHRRPPPRQKGASSVVHRVRRSSGKSTSHQIPHVQMYNPATVPPVPPRTQVMFGKQQYAWGVEIVLTPPPGRLLNKEQVGVTGNRMPGSNVNLAC